MKKYRVLRFPFRVLGLRIGDWGILIGHGPFFALSSYAGQAHADIHKQLKTGTRYMAHGTRLSADYADFTDYSVKL